MIAGWGARLRARRIALGMTLAEVAEVSGLSLPYVSNLERGHGNPTLDALRSLAQALKQPLTDILGSEASEASFDAGEIFLADAPRSLVEFTRSDRFVNVANQLSERQNVPAEEMSRRLMIGMASSPRRSSSEPTDDDWRRLLDAYLVILSDR